MTLVFFYDQLPRYPWLLHNRTFHCKERYASNNSSVPESDGCCVCHKLDSILTKQLLRLQLFQALLLRFSTVRTCFSFYGKSLRTIDPRRRTVLNVFDTWHMMCTLWGKQPNWHYPLLTTSQLTVNIAVTNCLCQPMYNVVYGACDHLSLSSPAGAWLCWCTHLPHKRVYKCTYTLAFIYMFECEIMIIW